MVNVEIMTYFGHPVSFNEENLIAMLECQKSLENERYFKKMRLDLEWVLDRKKDYRRRQQHLYDIFDHFNRHGIVMHNSDRGIKLAECLHIMKDYEIA